MTASPATTMHTQIMNIAPDQAMRWLDGNTHNRPLDHKYVDYLVGEIKGGRWKLMHQGIAFDPHGVLLDGQHRLWAIALSGVTVAMNVTFDAPADSLEYLDGGKLRTRAERMSLNNRLGLVRTAQLAVLRAMVRGLGPDRRLSYSEEVELMAEHKPVIDFAMGHLATSRIKGVSASATCAVVARAWHCADNLGRLERFCEVLRTGQSRGKDEDVVILLRDYLSSRDRSQTLTNLREHYGKVERALTAFLRGQSLTLLRPCTTEMFALPAEQEKAA
jgi:hypothetical protein